MKHPLKPSALQKKVRFSQRSCWSIHQKLRFGEPAWRLAKKESIGGSWKGSTGRQVGLVKFGLPKLDKNILVKKSMESDIYWNLSILFNLGSKKNYHGKSLQFLIGETSSTDCFSIFIR